MMSFLALDHIAAQRGDGLRPELVKPLELSRAITEVGIVRLFAIGRQRPQSAPISGLTKEIQLR
jgi:hypothetical protein